MGALAAPAAGNRLVRCPVPTHGKGRGDRNPSLSIRRTPEGRLLVHCFGGCDPRDVLEALGEEPGFDPREGLAALRSSRERAPGTAYVADLWALALARARDDDALEADREVWAFLRRRKLLLAWEERAFGILPPDEARLPAPVRSWPRRGFRLVAPLYRVGDGALVALQARRVRPGEPKTLFPKGSAVRGSCFANGAGRAVLASRGGSEPVLVLEGMTDFLALVGHVGEDVALLAVPGVGMARSLAGPWARRRRVFVAFDLDDAGEEGLAELGGALEEQGAEPHALEGWDEKDLAAAHEKDPEGFERFVAELLERVR